MMTQRGKVGVRGIDAQYRMAVCQRLDELLDEAGDDTAALAILENVRQQTLAGMTWDEQGKKSYLNEMTSVLVGTSRETPQTSTQMGYNETWTRSRYFMMGLCALVLVWVGWQMWWERPAVVIADEQEILAPSLFERLEETADIQPVITNDWETGLGREVDVRCFMVQEQEND